MTAEPRTAPALLSTMALLKEKSYKTKRKENYAPQRCHDMHCLGKIATKHFKTCHNYEQSA
jgi:hypothetical protein